MNLNRRDLLKILGVSASALALPFSRGLVAKDEIKRNYIFCYFDGGWDQLLCIDPRDPQKYTDKEASRYLTQPAYDQLGAGFGSDLIQPKGSNIAFGPAIGEFAKHYDKTCCITVFQWKQ